MFDRFAILLIGLTGFTVQDPFFVRVPILRDCAA
jgi:hypothetical protein